MQEYKIKEKVKERYGTIALTGNSDCSCCTTGELKDNNDNCCSPSQSATIIGYNNEELQSIPQESILGVGCGAPLHFADVKLKQ
jgi:arsenite methyltransferase